jgi:hypothetical protein
MEEAMEGDPFHTRKEQRSGYKQGMAGKTARKLIPGWDQKLPKQSHLDKAKAKAETGDLNREDLNSDAADSMGGKGERKAAASEWTLVQGKSAKKKEKRQSNGPLRMDSRLTPVQAKLNPKEYTSSDTPNVRVHKKKFLLDAATTDRRPDSIARVGTRDQSRRNWK